MYPEIWRNLHIQFSHLFFFYISCDRISYFREPKIVLKVEKTVFLQIFNGAKGDMDEMVVCYAQLTSDGGHCDTRVIPSDIINAVATRYQCSH
jgi:hypothetical protein